MIASAHLADVGFVKTIAAQRRRPRPSRTPGLRSAVLGFAGPLRPQLLPKPDFGRLALIAFWDDDAALDRFEAEHPLAQRFANG